MQKNESGASAPYYYKIGEVAKMIGVDTNTLYHWESKFPQLQPDRSTTNQRQYRQEHIELLRKIYHLRYVEKLPIEVVKQRLDTMGDTEINKIEAVRKLLQIKELLLELKEKV